MTCRASATRDKRDIYYRKAKEDGFRARSAYKLFQIDSAMNLFDNITNSGNKRGCYVVDLCCAPGSWSQAAAAIVGPSGGHVVGVDLFPVDPIEHCSLLVGDITDPSCVQRVLEVLSSVQQAANRITPTATAPHSPPPTPHADVVLFDGAHDVTHNIAWDEAVQHRLLVAAIDMAVRVLARRSPSSPKGDAADTHTEPADSDAGGVFVGKVFRGVHLHRILALLSRYFRVVTLAKPRASRVSSVEAFVVGQGILPSSAAGPAPFDAWLSAGTRTDAGSALDSEDDGVGHGYSSAIRYADLLSDDDACPPAVAPPHDTPSLRELDSYAFIQCGAIAEGDSDAAYDMVASPLPPPAPPLAAPYMPKQPAGPH